MKKFLSVIVFVIVCGMFNFCAAKDVFVYKYPDGNSLYIVYESVVYGYRTSFYAKFRIKRVNNYGELIRNEKWEIGHDEGDWWYSIEGISRDVRVYDYEDSAEVLNWLKEHRDEAHKTSRPYELVLGD